MTVKFISGGLYRNHAGRDLDMFVLKVGYRCAKYTVMKIQLIRRKKEKMYVQPFYIRMMFENYKHWERIFEDI